MNNETKPAKPNIEAAIDAVIYSLREAGHRVHRAAVIAALQKFEEAMTATPQPLPQALPVAAAQAVAPAGWKLVPVYPTDAMMDCFSGMDYNRLNPGKRTAEQRAYAAMLAAAPAQPSPAPQPLAEVADSERLSKSEQKAILEDPAGIACLLNRHDCWISEAEGRGMNECIPAHERRITELLAIGRAVLAQDPEIWTNAGREPFKQRHSELAQVPDIWTNADREPFNLRHSEVTQGYHHDGGC